jgi:hypothetical protein
MFNVFDFTGAGMPGEHLENGANHLLRVHPYVVAKGPSYVIQKLFLVPLLDWLSGKLPSLVVKAANQHGQLGAELHRFFHSQPIAEGMKNRSQSEVRFLGIPSPVKLVH